MPCGVPAASRSGRPPSEQQQINTQKNFADAQKDTNAQTEEHTRWRHLQNDGIGAQAHNSGPANPLFTPYMQPAAQACSWPQQEQVQHVQARQAPRQSSMQSFMALHASRLASAQPTLTATATAPPSSSHIQQPFKPNATGVLADDADDCIDLTSQPDARQAVQRCDVVQHAVHEQPAAAGGVGDGQADTNEGGGAMEDIMDNGSEELMECSPNLLNPGIRVHKYSFGFPLHALDSPKYALHEYCSACVLTSVPSHHSRHPLNAASCTPPSTFAVLCLCACR